MKDILVTFIIYTLIMKCWGNIRFVQVVFTGIIAQLFCLWMQLKFSDDRSEIQMVSRQAHRHL